MKSAPAIGFRYRASRLLIAAMFAAAALASVAIWLSALPEWARLTLILATEVYAGVALANLLRPRVRSVLWRADGGAELTLHERATDARRETQGAIHAARVMGPLIALTLSWPSRGRAALWLLPDNLDVDTRRRLRMRLGAAGGDPPASGNTDSG